MGNGRCELWLVLDEKFLRILAGLTGPAGSASGRVGRRFHSSTDDQRLGSNLIHRGFLYGGSFRHNSGEPFTVQR